jgi:hypothetical protein
MGTLGDERLGGSEPQAAAATGHQIDPVSKSEVHPTIMLRRSHPGSPCAASWTADRSFGSVA